MKLSLLIPTFNSAGTIERSLEAALAQRHRPLEICVYDEASRDGTRSVVERVVATSAPDDIDIRFWHREENSGPVGAWRILLQQASGDWCCFVWADDLLQPDYSRLMMEGARRAARTGRRIVFSSALLEIDGELVSKYSQDQGVLTPAEFSSGIFLRRYSLNQINGVYETATAKSVFEDHADISNPLGFDYTRFPYGNDVGFLSDLAAAGNGVELLPQGLVHLVLSAGSMTRRALSRHLWRFRWQYTFSFFRVWRSWQSRGMPEASGLVELASRRLTLCELMMGRGWSPGRVLQAVAAYRDYRRLDYERSPVPLERHRAWVAGLIPPGT